MTLWTEYWIARHSGMVSQRVVDWENEEIELDITEEWLVIRAVSGELEIRSGEGRCVLIEDAQIELLVVDLAMCPYGDHFNLIGHDCQEEDAFMKAIVQLPD